MSPSSRTALIAPGTTVSVNSCSCCSTASEANTSKCVVLLSIELVTLLSDGLEADENLPSVKEAVVIGCPTSCELGERTPDALGGASQTVFLPTTWAVNNKSFLRHEI